MGVENLMIVQGGGPTAVFNASLASIVRESQVQPRVERIFGARWGMQGLAGNDVIDLTDLSPGALESIRMSPGAALGSSRFKPTEEDLDSCVDLLRRLSIQYLIFLGGNGTMRGAELFRQFCRDRKLGIQIMGVPKTIDNDISSTDRCPGFGSAARYVAQSTLDLAMDIRSLPPPVSIFETLGRDVGWLAASSTLAKSHTDDAPHIVCIPEVPFVLNTFLMNLAAIVKRLGWAVVVVSEGTRYADGTPVFEQTLPSRNGAPIRPLIGGVAQHLSGLIAEHLGLRCRSEKPGFLGRSCMANVAPQDRIDAELVGRAGVIALLSGQTDQMVALCPLGLEDTAAYLLVPLDKAAGPQRPIPDDWLSNDLMGVNEAFRRYIHPMVGVIGRYSEPL